MLEGVRFNSAAPTAHTLEATAFHGVESKLCGVIYLGISGVLKGIKDLLESHNVLCLPARCLPHHSICLQEVCISEQQTDATTSAAVEGNIRIQSFVLLLFHAQPSMSLVCTLACDAWMPVRRLLCTERLES